MGDFWRLEGKYQFIVTIVSVSLSTVKIWGIFGGWRENEALSSISLTSTGKVKVCRQKIHYFLTATIHIQYK